MAFIVTLIALLIERFFDWSHLRQWGWYNNYQTLMMQKAPANQPYVGLAMTIVPLVIVVLLVQFFLRGMLYGVIDLIFQVLVVLYCLGPRSLWADAFGCITALTTDKQSALEKLKTEFGVVESDSTSLHQLLLNKIFIEANRRVFAPLFWFVLLGPAFIVLYRTVCESAKSFSEGDNAELSRVTHIIEAVLDWAPIRLMGLLFAAGSYFSKVFSVFSKNVGLGLEHNDALIIECGNAALGVEEDKIAEDGSTERKAINLLDRTFVIFLILVIILVWIM